jgi:PhzF family phenazine biosynthesis protein
MNIERFAAFSDGALGGNPAGVVICDLLPEDAVMQAIAAEVGYSETVFASWEGEAWKVRYFAPAREVPFCGHATVALGAALLERHGAGLFPLRLYKGGRASVEALATPPLATAILQSPPSSSRPAPASWLAASLALFGWSEADLDPRLPPAIINAGADHLLLALRSRRKLAAMRYDQEAGKSVMDAEGLATISLVFAETAQHFHARNPFASGGVYEDPATGAAAAALGGYLRRIRWPHDGRVTIVQGEDMGVPSHLRVEISEDDGAGIRVGGSVRRI